MADVPAIGDGPDWWIGNPRCRGPVREKLGPADGLGANGRLAGPALMTGSPVSEKVSFRTGGYFRAGGCVFKRPVRPVQLIINGRLGSSQSAGSEANWLDWAAMNGA